jgi:hypothetical protein
MPTESKYHIVDLEYVQYKLSTRKHFLGDLTEGNVKNLKTVLTKFLKLGAGLNDFVMEIEEEDQMKPILTFTCHLPQQLDALGNKLALVTVPLRFLDMSHRASLVMGFYDTPLPYPPSPAVKIISPSAPYACYGNMLYLTSKQGNSIHSANVQHPAVIFRIHEYLKYNMVLLCKPKKEERDEVIADPGALRQIDLSLVDRWFQPVKILNPMIVTIKMEPIMEEQIWYG